MMLQCHGACLLMDMTSDVAVPWCLSTGGMTCNVAVPWSLSAGGYDQ